MDGPTETDPTPSELGTKEYWLKCYDTEVRNFDNYGDPGEIWFGEDSHERILRWMENKETPKDARIIDIGCGNGMMLIELRKVGYSDLTGIDYCPNAIELSKSVAASHEINDIKYSVVDITCGSDLADFDLALDKGTYDAVSLNPVDQLDKRKKYIQNVANLLKDNGLLILTTCNWTHNEIATHFQEEFSVLDVLPTPSFTFGGVVGNVITALVLKKKNAT